MMKVCLIINASRKLSNLTKETISLLDKSAELEVEQYFTSGPKAAIELAKTHSLTSDIIIAIGGDGTCNEVVNGIQLSNRTNIVFGIIPNGTGNDFQRNLGLFNPHHFVNSILNNSFKKIDLCRVIDGQNTTYALNIAGAGFDGFVVHKLNRQRQYGFGGKLSYSWAIVRSFFSFKKPLVHITSDDQSFDKKVLMIAVCNGTTFGHGMTIHPGAKIDDGLLSVAMFCDVSFTDYVKNLAKLKKGKWIQHPEVYYLNTSQFELKVKDGVLYREVDGELNGDGSVKFQVKPKALNLLVTN